MLRIIDLATATKEFPEAIARLRRDRSFIFPGAGPMEPRDDELIDEHDRFCVIEDDLLFVNLLDMLVDIWDPVDGCWMEYTSPWDHGHGDVIDPTGEIDDEERLEEKFWEALASEGKT